MQREVRAQLLHYVGFEEFSVVEHEDCDYNVNTKTFNIYVIVIIVNV